MNDTNSAGTENRTVTSEDGSTIAYEVSGSGPVVILVAQALADRKDHRKLAALLSADHTVINYDRRGRGGSTEAGPWSIRREIEDIDALIAEYGGTAAMFGASSGAVLALEAADSLGDRISGVMSFEAPVIVDGGRPPIPRDLPAQLGQLVRDGRSSRAVSTFMRQALGVPAGMTFAMRMMFPVWRQMTAMAQTTEYDLTLCAGLQDGRPIPDGRWTDIDVPVLVLVGEKSDPWAHTSAAAVADLLRAPVETIPKAHHGTPTMKPQAIIRQLREFMNSMV